MRPLPIAFSLMLAAVAAPAASVDRLTDAERIAQATAGLVPGAPIACFDRRRETRFTMTDRSLIFRVNPRLTYINTPSAGCEGKRPNDAMVSRTPQTRLCRNDSVRMVNPIDGIQSGSCSLNDFVPYTPAP